MAITHGVCLPGRAAHLTCPLPCFPQVSLADLVTKQGMELIISEWGFGGGYLDGTSISPDAQYLVDHPFYGIWGTYNKAKDPWSNPAFQAIRCVLVGMCRCRCTARFMSACWVTGPCT